MRSHKKLWALSPLPALRTGTHVGRRCAVAGTEYTVEIRQIAEAGREGDGADGAGDTARNPSSDRGRCRRARFAARTPRAKIAPAPLPADRRARIETARNP